MIEMTQEALFSICCPVHLSGEPCLACKKAVPGEICEKVFSCKRYHTWLKSRRSQISRITKASDRNMSSICHTCPVSGACPVSFEEKISFCPVKCNAFSFIARNARPRG